MYVWDNPTDRIRQIKGFDKVQLINSSKITKKVRISNGNFIDQANNIFMWFNSPFVYFKFIYLLLAYSSLSFLYNSENEIKIKGDSDQICLCCQSKHPQGKHTFPIILLPVSHVFFADEPNFHKYIITGILNNEMVRPIHLPRP